MPKGNIGRAPFGGKLLIRKILGSKPMSVQPKKQEKKIIDSEIKNILNAVIILFCTRIVILPSLDSTSKSVDQLLKTTGNSILAIIKVSNVITLNHRDIINRKAEIATPDGPRRSSVIKKG